MSMDEDGPETPGGEADGDPGATPPAEPGDGPAGVSVPAVQERRLSRRAAWLAMGAVVLALVLLWVAPGTHDEQSAFAGMPAPLHFTLKDVNGIDVKLESFRGKVILVNFWATWCGPCKVEIPDLVALQKEYVDDVVVLGIEIDGSAELVKPFATEFKMNYPVLLAAGRQDVQDAFGPLYGIPVTVFVDRDGRIAKRHALMMTREQFEHEIKGLL
jgi:thiol-disulfide isomerase/thioredoxin